MSHGDINHEIMIDILFYGKHGLTMNSNVIGEKTNIYFLNWTYHD